MNEFFFLQMTEEESKQQPSEQPTEKDSAPKTEEDCQNFAATDPYRIEHWYNKLREFTFESEFLDVDPETCKAITKYAEGVREVRQCLKFQNTVEDRLSVHEAASKQPPCSKKYMDLLKALEQRLDTIIKKYGDDGAFVKLSTRSPKDTALEMHEMRMMVADALAKDLERAGGEMDEDSWHCCGVSAVVDACCKVLRVKSGAEAMYLMLHSYRVYTDITRMELANNGNAEVQIAVRRWDPRVVPALEFRTFVYNHVMTACTQYYKLIYDANMAAHSKEISDLIWKFHEEHIKPRMEIATYTADFAVTADLKDIICVEINDPPPAAGTALFNWDDPADRKIIENGPYEFRCNTSFPKTSFGELNDPLPYFIDSLRTKVPENHVGFACDCCGTGRPENTSNVSPSLCGIHGIRYHCKDCTVSFDICEECWNAGWGLRHVTVSKSEHCPNGHTFVMIKSPASAPVEAGVPPSGPKSEIPPPKQKSVKKQDEDGKNCSIQ